MKIARFNMKFGKTQRAEEHLKNVGEICRQSAEKIKLSNTAYLIGVLHDMGKLCDDFQNYIQCKDNISSESKVDHGVYGAKYIFSMYENGEYIQKITSQIIAIVICYHHGGLPDCINKNDIPLLKRMNKLSKDSVQKVAEEFKELFPDIDIPCIFSKACKEIQHFINVSSSSNCKIENILFEIHLLIKILYSILIDSDWLDSYLFEADIPFDDNKSNSLASNLEMYVSNIKSMIDSFKKFKPTGNTQKIVYEKRNQIAHDCLNFAKNKTGIYTLTVPTGGGKTFSSFGYALSHAKEHNKDRIIYVAPYTSIIEQNAEQIRQAIQCGENLLEYHSNVITEENDDTKLFSSRWDYHFVFTTMVQFLNTIYAAPSQDIRRFQSLTNSIIILDEVQTVPLRCISLFNSAVNFLHKYLNCTIVLCTATQPVLDKVPKPVMLSNNCEIISDVEDAFNKFKRVNVVDRTINGGYSVDQVIKFIESIRETYSSILLIVNTISAAEKIFNLAKETNFEGKLFYLSSNLCPGHRKQVIDDMKCALKNDEPVICISTQVIECGVDISFSTVIRSIAGIDSIAQAVGRCNRHGEKELSNAFIINLKDDLENTSRLLSIDIGKKKTIGVLDLYMQNPQSYDNSLISNKAILDYFERFINEDKVKEQFDYPLSCEDGTIYELLSKKSSLINTYNAYAKQKYELCFCFQFKTARENFSVIDSKTKTIIVPFGEGKEIISDLTSSQDFKNKILLLRKAQHYSVNVFEDKFKQLQNLGAITSCDIEGVYLLKECYYSNYTGVSLECEMDFLCS